MFRRHFNAVAQLALASSLFLIAGCASVPPTEVARAPALHHAELKTLCASDAAPADAKIAAALGMTEEAVLNWRRARALEAEQVCRLDEKRLARSLSRGKKESLVGGSEDVKKYIELIYRDEHGNIPDGALAQALRQREALVSRDKAGGVGSWTSLGPSVVGGRVLALLYDRTDANRVYLGAASGGIWLSTDGGNNWSAVNDFTASLGISALAQDASNPNTLYAATGEWAQGFRGAGLMKSTDRGASWSAMNSTDPAASSCWRYVQDVAVHPANSSILLAANWCGIDRSTDAGATWSRVYSVQNTHRQLGVGARVLFSPNDPNRVLVGMTNRQLALSTNGGASFNAIQLGADLNEVWTGRVNLAWSASQPSTVYASVNENKGDVYQSTDSGATWAKVSNPAALGNQGDYGNAIWVDPADPNTVIVGGIDLYRSSDGAATWTKISDWTRQYYLRTPYSAHADHHVIVAHPGYNGSSNRIALFGTDGGLFRADDARSVMPVSGWQVASSGLVTTQFYAATGKKDANGLALIGGTQDNSVFALSPVVSSAWKQPGTGDGGPSYFDPQDASRAYFSDQYLYIGRWNLATGNWDLICEGITEATKPDPDRDFYPCGRDATQKTNFISPYVVDPSNGERIFAGAASLWLSENARSGSTPSWRIVKDASTVEFNGGQNNYISAVTLKPGSSSIVWVGHNNGDIFHSSNATAGSPTWTQISAGTPARWVTKIVFDPNNTNRMFLTYGGFSSSNLWMSSDGGNTWSDISSGLPQAPVYTLAVHPTQPNVLYAGTETGLYVSENSGASWSTHNDGPAATIVRDLFFVDSSTLIAGTYGRGLWQTSTFATVATIPVYEFYNTSLVHYFRTASEAEANGIDQGSAGPGWQRTGDNFRAYPTQVAGSQGVCRFYGTPGKGPNSHFYTIDPVECANVKTDPGWTYEGIAFFAMPPGSGGSCAAGSVPIYRVYNNRYMYNDSNHRFTTSASVYAQMQAAGWSAEGVVMCTPGS